jgi:acyl transferase domain-containing protein/acyl carrier protein/SAM-dependent methyltransferase
VADSRYGAGDSVDVNAVLRAVAEGRLPAEEAHRLLADALGETRAYRPVWSDAPLAVTPTAESLVVLDEATIAIGGEAEFIRALQPPPSCLVHRSSFGRFNGEVDQVERQIDASLLSLARLVPALPTPCRLQVIYRENQPHYAALVGFARTIRREMPGLGFKTIGIRDDDDAIAIARREAAEHASADIRYVDGRRQELGYEDASIDDGASARLRDGGVYLVTGGGGGLGLIVAEHLSRRYGVQVVRCGRSDAAGADYIKADVTHRADVAALVSEIQRRHGRLDGVFHVAGVRDDARIESLNAGRIAAVLAPKVRGTLLLDEATRDLGLDCFVMFSAAAAAIGNPGQSAYAYANSFLDQFAEWRDARRRDGAREGRSLSIQWPLWASGGMQVDEHSRELLKRTVGMMPLTRADGLAMFDAALAGDLTTVTITCGRQAKLRAALGSARSTAAAGTAKETSAPSAEMRRQVEQELARLVSEILKVSIEDLDAGEDLSAYGFDSITLTQLANDVNRRYDVETTPALFFESPTIAAVASRLCAESAAQVGRIHAPAAVSQFVPAAIAAPAVAVTPAPATKTEQRHAASPLDVAIVGIAGAMPGSPNLQDFWSHLAAGDDLVSEVPSSRWDWRAHPEARWGGFVPGVDQFDCAFFGISPREAARMDPQQRLVLAQAWKCVEDAGYRASDLAGSRTGVFIGAASPDYYELLRQAGTEVDGYTSIGISFSVLANRVSHYFDWRGPSQPVDTACSSSLVAVHHAVEAIRRGACDAALAGGVNVVLSPTHTIAASRAGMLSPDGRCKTFSARADGYVRSEGVGLVFLKPLDRAIADGDTIYAVIKGVAENHGGRTGSLTAPNPAAQADLLVRAYEEADIDPATVGYIEAHGTGTAIGDPVEINGLKSAFSTLYARRGLAGAASPHCGLGSVKSSIGHLETGAGIAGLLKVVLAMRHQWLPGTLHLDEVNPYIDLQSSPFFLCQGGRAWGALTSTDGTVLPRRAGVSSFGFGGANAHVVVEEYTQHRPADAHAPSPHLFVLSAKNAERLDAYAAALAAFVGTTTASLGDIAFTLLAGREPMEERLAVVASTCEELADKLRTGRDVRRGSAAVSKGPADAVISGSAGDAFVRALAAEGDWDKLAQLWVAGTIGDLRSIAGTAQRVPLPTYPFAPDRHWLPSRREPAAIATAPDTVVLSGHEYFLTDHVVRGEKTLPGVMYLELARAAAGRVTTMRNVVWSRPIVVSREPREVRIEILRDNAGARFEIRTRDGVHAEGRLFRDEAVPVGVLDLAAIRRRCDVVRTAAECYAAFDGNGFTSGPAFHAIQELTLNRDEALSVLALPGHLAPEAPEMLHPSLMDGALETVVGLIGNTNGVPWLPFALDGLRISAPLPARCVAHVTRAGQHPGTFDICLADEAGRVVVEMRGLMFRPLVDAAATETVLFAPLWVPEPASASRSNTHARDLLIAGDIASLLQLAAAPRRAVFAGGVTAELSAVAALARTLRAEQPAAVVSTLDLDDAAALEQCLAAEAESDEVEVRYRQGQRLVRRWEELPSPVVNTPSPLKWGGVYLVTGGAGGLGRIIAEHLVAVYGASVIAAGRAAVADGLPGGVIYRQCDVTDESSVRETVAWIKERFGRLDGVFHAAGLLRDGLAIRKSAADAAAVLAPKVRGTQLLDEATRDEALDLFVLFSSASAVIGNAGQSDYAYANGFLDGFAEQREAARAAGHRSGRTISINWPLWRDGGMHVDAETETLLRRSRGVVPLTTPAGLEALDRALRAQAPRVAVLAGERDKIMRLLPMAGAAPVNATLDATVDADALSRFREAFVAEVRHVLELPASQGIDLDDDLSNCGFDSLSFTALANRLNERLGLAITPAVFFQFPTLGAASASIFQRSSEQLATRKPALPAAVIAAPDRRNVPATNASRADDPIAIIGISGILPQSPDLETFWTHLDRGDDLIREVPADRWDWREFHGDPARDGDKTLARWGGFLDDVGRFDCLFFGISPREAELMDPQQRLLLEAVWSLIENAGHRASELSGTKTGVFVGVSTTDYFELLRDAEGGLDAHTATGITSSILPNRISYLLNLRGPSEAIDTACSSSLVAIHRAVQAIRSGACEMAIAGGTNVLLSPTLTIAGSKAGMLSPDGRCKTFDRGANGYVRGEGVGAVLLKPLSRALADGDYVYALVRGTAENHGGHAASLTAPNPVAQAEVIVEAYDRAGVHPADVSYIEAHGTGTSLGDPIEITGLTQAFAELFRRRGAAMPAEPHCAIGSAKTNIGHLEAAAGVAGILKVVLSMQHGRLPRLLNFTALNPYIELQGSPFFVLSESRPWTGPRIAGVSSFGFGGVNAHVVLEHYDMAAPAATPGPHLIVLSARNDDRLRAMAARLADALTPETNLAAAAYTLRAGREPMESRLAMNVSSIDELRARLRRFAADGVIDGDVSAAVDWSSVPATPGRRIPLPSYPFGGTRHWVTPRRRAVNALHPLIDRNESTLTEVCFTTTLDAGRNWLRDHVINGARVLPGVVYLEMARAAARLAEPNAPVAALANVTWHRPLVVAASPVTVSIRLSREAQGAGFSISTEDGLHASGTVRYGAFAAAVVDLTDIQRRCHSSWNVADVFAQFARRGLQYGESFRALQALSVGADDALAEIALSTSAAQPGLELHPAILEAALQSVAGLIDDESMAMWVPYSLGSLEIDAPLEPRCFAHAQRVGAHGRMQSFAITIAAADGRVLARLADFAMVMERGTGAVPEPVAAQAEPARGADDAVHRAAEQMIKRLVATQTKVPIEEIRAHDALERYGIDSMLVVSLTRDLEERFGALSKTLFFEYQTVAELAEYFAANHAAKLGAPPARAAATVSYRPPAILKSPARVERAAVDRSTEDIAVVGVSGRYPRANDLGEFWENLKAGRDCISEVPRDRWDIENDVLARDIYSKWGGFIDGVDQFDPRFFSITPKEAELLDPQERLFLETVWHTIEDAGYSRSSLAAQKVGVYVGVMWGEYQLFGPGEALKGHPVAPASSFASIANRVSYFFNFHGPSIALDTMCSSSLTALHLACESLRRGECDAAIAGGVNVSIHPQKYLLLSQSHFASTDGRCRSFGEGGDGYVPGEGVGAVLLKPLARALEDGDQVYAVIKGSAINHGGKTNGYTVPNPNAQAALIAETLGKCGVEPATIGYVEAHGTGTALGDPIEVTALAKAFGADRPEACVIGSVKSNIGHLESAAGIAALTKVLLQLKHRLIVPSLHSATLNARIDFDASGFDVAQGVRAWEPRGGAPRRAGISSFGAGGSNAHVILEELEAQSRSEMDTTPQIVALSARTRDRLDAMAAALAAAVDPSMRLSDIAFTLQVGREPFAERLAVVADSVLDLQRRLRSGDGVITGTAADSLLEGDEGREYLARLVGSGKLEKLARLWVAGTEIEWTLLHSADAPRRISLPGYPFARQRYWIPIAGLPSESRAKGDDMPVAASSPVAALTGNEPFFRDHVVGGSPMLPAVAYIELARRAAGMTTGGFRDFVWLKPITTAAGLTVRASSDAVEFRIGDVLHAEARLDRDFAGAPNERLDLAAIRQRCAKATTGERCYETLAAMGLAYGPAMRGLRHVVSSEHELLAEVGEPTGAADVGLSPVLLDAALQALVTLADGAAAQLPFSLDRIRFSLPLPARAMVHATRRATKFDIAITDVAGHVLVRLDGLSLRPIPSGDTTVFLTRAWREAALTSSASPAGPVVLLDDSDARRDELARRLGVEVTLMRPGEDPAPALARASRVVHLWSRPSASLDEELERGVFSLLRVIKTLLSQRTAQPAQILFVHPPSPAFAAVSGLLKTLRQENPRFVCKTVAVHDETTPVAAIVAAELQDDASEDVRYRGGVRSIARLEEALSRSGARTIRHGGVYLITGGAGGLGRLFARYLADTHGARVVVSGRSTLSPEEQTSLGADYIAADVSVADEARRLIAEVRSRHGAISGIIHAAGVLRDGLLLKQSAEDFAAVIRPKVFGTANLLAAAAGEPLDFFVLCSSIASVLGNVGQGAYAFANGYLDAVAESGPANLVSINWPLWAEGGMHAPTDVVAWAARTFGVQPLATAPGLRALTAAIAGEAKSVAVLAGDRHRIIQTLASAPVPAPAAPPAEPVRISQGDLRQRTERYLAEVLAREAKLSPDELTPTARLEDCGFDSVMVLNATRALELVFGPLSKALFFEHASIDGLAGYFLDKHAAVLAEKFAVTQPPPPATQPAAVIGQPAATVPDDRIAVIGVSGRYPMAANLREFWDNLQRGRDCITEVPASRWRTADHPNAGRWGGFLDDVDRFDPLFFHISPREANLIDPQERLFLQTAWHTLEDAGYTRARLAGSRTGVYVGVMWSEYQLLGLESRQAPSSTYASIANRVSFFLDLHGTSLAVDTMCSSSLTALHLACESLRHGENDVALAGGVNLSIHPHKYELLSQGHFLSSDGRCRSFGEGGDGYVPGEGVGAVLLKRLDRAIADGDYVHAVITATALNHGGRTNGYSIPNPRAQSSVIADALRRGRVDSSALSYIEAHGTGTALGDPIEVAGLATAFAEVGEGTSSRCAIGSVKSNIGHLESAAGIAGLTKVLLQMRHGQLVPSLHADTLNPHVDLAATPFVVQRSLESWPAPRVAGISSFGAGGSNAHVLLEGFSTPATEPQWGRQTVVLSARNADRLRASVEQLLAFVEAEQPGLSDLAYTLQVGREAMEARAAFIVSTNEELCQRLREYLAGQQHEASSPEPVATWLQGGHVDWERESAPQSRRRIPLPGYPFAGERYWLRRTATEASATHPLLDGISAARSLAEPGLAFTKTLTRDAAVVRDHEVRGLPVLPGAAYLEMALAAAARIAPAARFTIADVVWLKPLAVADRVEVEILLRGRGERIAYEIRSAAGLHGKGVLQQEVPAAIDALDLAGIRNRCGEGTDGESLYRRFAVSGLVYGPYFKGVRQVWGGAGEALAEIVLPAAAVGARCTLHPAFIDSALQSIAGIAGLDATATTLSFAVDTVEIGQPSPSRGFAHVRQTGSDRFDIVIADESGQACVRLTGVTVRSMRAQASSALFAPAWRPASIEAVPAPVPTAVMVVAGSWSERVAREFPGPVHFVNGAEDVLRLSRAWPSTPLQVALITVDAASVLPGETPAPNAAAAAAFAAVLAKERPSLSVRTLDVPVAEMEDEETWRVARQWLAGAPAAGAIRLGQFFAPVIERIELPAPALRPFRDHGVYLLIGGAGGLGFEVSKHLARTCSARLAWIGRRPLDAAIEKQRSEIAALGGSALYLAGDVGDPAALSQALDAVMARFGELHGVFHSAMDVRPQLIESMDDAQLRAALHAKTTGSLVLADLLADRPLDFLVYFSSVQSMVRARGMGAYAAGCAFEDALAIGRSQSAPYPITTINWGYWGSVGAAAADDAAAAKRLAESMGFESIESAEGMEALGRIVAQRDRAQVIVFKGDLALLGAPVSEPGGTVAASVADQPQMALATLQRLRDASSALDEYCVPLLVNMFQAMGVFTRIGEEHDAANLRNWLGIAPSQFRQYEALLGVLERAGILRVASTVIVRCLPDDRGRMTLAELQAAHPEVAAHADLVTACLAAGDAMLRGTTPATDVIFPQGRTALVERIYTGNPSIDYFNRQLAAQVRELASRVSGPLRILEIGAGTGGSTAGVLDALQAGASRTRYVCTDKSPGLVQHARKRFASGASFAEFQVLDIERDPRSQGLTGPFDIVVAANVLHATTNIAATLANVASVMAPGAALVLSETTGVQDITTLTFGFLDGWWRFDDEAARLPGGPLLSVELWERALASAGLSLSASIAHESIAGYDPPQHVLVATAAPATPTPRAAADAAESAVIATLAAVLEIAAPAFDRDTPYTEFGVDSILAVEIVDRINERLGIALRATDLFNYPTIAKLTAHIEAHTATATPLTGDAAVLDILQRLADGSLDAETAGRRVEELA